MPKQKIRGTGLRGRYNNRLLKLAISNLALSTALMPTALLADTNSKPEIISLAAVSTSTDAGNQRAEVLLAMANMYRLGEGVNRNETRAFDYLKRAARLGLAEAQFQLASMYLESSVIQQNEDEAIRWLERAAAQGHKNASFTYNYVLNNTYYEGC